MKAVLISLVVAALAATPAAVQAASFSIPTSARGFAVPGGSGPIDATADYSTGFFGSSGEFRSYFAFELPAFTGKVTSARLSLAAGRIATNGSFPISYQLTSFTRGDDFFAALGTGTVFGTRDFVRADGQTTVSIDLNSAGVAALNSGATFEVAGRVTNNGLSDLHALFNATNGAPVTLDFDTVVAAIPEPASWAMLITGFGLAGSALRRRRAAIA